MIENRSEIDQSHLLAALPSKVNVKSKSQNKCQPDVFPLRGFFKIKVLLVKVLLIISFTNRRISVKYSTVKNHLH